MFFLLKDRVGATGCLTKWWSRMTDGTVSAVDGDRITWAVSSTRSALPTNSKTTALRALQTRRGSKVWFRINTLLESIEQ
jgi:hypothetical protein